ncbi:MAG: LacI family DNA-binding transcriptional regulator [Pseudomonadota bacterium]
MNDGSSGQPGKARLKDVAALAGVSQGTASNVFNKPDLVAENLREQVLQAAQKLGYTGPQPAARLLRSGKAGCIALLTDASAAYLVSDAYGQRLLAGAAQACDAAGLGLTIVGQGAAKTASGWSVDTAIADGFVIYCFEENDGIFDRLRRRGGAYVTVDGGRRGGLARIGIDEEAAAASAMAHLTDLGHRRVGILTLELTQTSPPGPIDAAQVAAARYRTTGLRLRGYAHAAALAGVGAEDCPAFQTRNSAASARLGVDWMLSLPNPPTALACMSDVIALAAMARLKERGLSVPRDISVVGFDGIAAGALSEPALTTIIQPAEEKGRAAVNILVDGRPTDDEILPARLCVRASTAPPPR